MIRKKIGEYDFLLEFRLSPCAEKWSLDSRGEKEGIVIEKYKSGDYTLKLELESNIDSYVLWFDLSREHGKQFIVEENKVISRISTVNVHRIWGPPLSESGGERNALFLPWFYENEVATHHCMPVLFTMDRTGRVVMAFGFIDQRLETIIKTSFPGLYDYEFSEIEAELKRPIKGVKVSSYCDGIFVSSGMDWFNTMRKYTRTHDIKMRCSVPELPDYAYDPVWNTVKSGKVLDDVNEKNVFENAKIAAEQGFKTILIDAGWYCDTGKWHYTQCGDYIAHKEKFPEMKKFVHKLKKLGLRVILWCGPFMIGKESRSREDLEKSLIQLEVKNKKVPQDTLCPRNPFVQDHVAKLLARIITDYDVDGLKLDFIDSIPSALCVAEHEHNYESLGLAMDVCLRKIREAIDTACPGALIEYRTRYANINNRPYANLFRASDCPLDYDLNRKLCTVLRSFSEGVAVHVDPVLWHPQEEIRNIAKTMMTAILVGVPTVGMNLVEIPKDQLKLIERWIAFYKAHREDLSKGNYLPVQNDPQVSIIKIEREERTYILLCSSPTAEISLVANKIEDIHVFNCTNKGSLYVILPGITGRFKATIFDEWLNEKTKEYIESKEDKLIADLRIPQGGYAMLQRKN